MTSPTYLDFDIAIQRNGEQYRAQVINSPGGQANAPLVLPFSSDKLENLILRMGLTRQKKRRGTDSARMQAAKELGAGLFHALLSNSVARCWEKSLTIAAERRMGLRVRLRLNEAPELADLPWEYLYDDSTLNRFYQLSKDTPLVRYLELPEPPGALAVTPPLNILLVISSPLDYEPLDVEREHQSLANSLAELSQHNLVTLTRLPQPTLAALRRSLRNQEFHILHFVGHGVFQAGPQRGAVVLEDDERQSVQVDGEVFARIIQDHNTLRLVMLNSCEGARPTRNDPFGGFAQRIIQQGIPAVIAMQFEITDDAAITFAREFYAALADNYPVDAALAEARKAIYALPNETEWGTPVLYSRAPDGLIFDVRGAPPPAQSSTVGSATDSSFGPLLKQARSAQREAEQILEDNPKDTAAAKEKYKQAQELLERAAQSKPDDARVMFYLGQVLMQSDPGDTKRAGEQFRRAERLLTDPSTDDEKRLLANIIFARATLTDPPNEKLLWRAGELADQVNDEILLGRIEQAVQRLADSNAGTRSTSSFQSTNRVEPSPYAYENPNVPAPPPFAVDPNDVTDPNWRPPGADDFNPIGRWNIQVQDMVGSRLFVEFAPNGMFQMMQQVGLYQVPVNGTWGYNPQTRQLGLQGVVNSFQPFMLAMTINNALPNGYAAVGNDGIGYVLTRA